MPKVGLSTGVERREILRKAAYYIRSETAKQITARPVIMPRVSPPGSEITRTRGDAIRGVLEELIHFHDDEIKYFEFEEIVVCANPDEIQGMDQFTSAERMKELPIHVENLYEQGPWDEVEIRDAEGNTDTVRVNRRIKDAALRISISVPSSDPAFGIYGSLQNMIFAVHPADRARLQGVPEEVALSDHRAAAVSSSLLIPEAVQEIGDHPDKYDSTHQTLQDRVVDYQQSESDIGLQYRALYSNLANLAEHLLPDLAFVDGTYVVDGSGERLEGGFAFSGDDPVAVDTALAGALGMDVDGLGHLQYLQQHHYGCADQADIKIARGNPDELNIPFSPHPDEERRLSWHHVRLPGEDGEAVGYIAPEQETEQEEGETDETAADSETDSADQATGAAEEEPTQTASDESTETTETEDTSGGEGEAAAVEPDEDLDVKERVRRRLIRRGKMEGELPEGAAAGETAESQQSEEEDAEEDETTEPDEEVDEHEVAEAGGADEQQVDQEEQDTPDEQEEDATEEGASEESEPAGEGGGTVSGADVVLAGDDVRERVRNRLIQRGKMEGELPDGVEMPQTTADADEAEETEDAAESEPEPGEEEPKQEEEKTTEGSSDDAGEDEDESTSEEPSESEGDGAGAGGPVSGEDVVLEGEDVRERVRNRLIQRGKMDGELPEGIDQPASSSKEEDGSGGEQEETEPAAEETEKDEQDQQTEAEAQEDASEEGAEDEAEEEEEEEQQPADTAAERDEDLDPRERIERRLIRRGKMEGELPEDAEGAPVEEEESDGDSESASAEEAKEVEDADRVDGTVEVTTSSGPSLEPSDDISDPQEVLENLSDYEPEDKIRRRLAIRRRAVQGTAGDNGEASEADDSPEEPDASSESESSDAADETEEETGGETETEQDEEEDQESAGDVSGYDRDPDAALRDRVQQRLSERGKL